MMCKFLKLPSQDPRLALSYVAGAVDAKGVAHDQVILMRGVPADFLRVASGLTFKERYKSFIASWSPGDAPNPEQMERVIESLERLLFGDLDPSRFSYVIYVHRKDDKIDLHAVIANVELTSGLSFNAAPPRWQGSFDAWRDMHNAAEGWASPADTRLARPVQPGAQPHFKNARARQGKATPASLRAEISAYALDLVNSGLVESREALIHALANHGAVHRVNPVFLSVIPPELGKPVRLKGTIFEEDFDFAAAAKRGPRPAPLVPKASRTAKDHDVDRDPVAEETARQRFEAAVARRLTHNLERFAPKRRRAFARKNGASTEPGHQDIPKEEAVPAPMDLGMHDTTIDLEIASHHSAGANASVAGRMAPQLLCAIPTHLGNAPNNISNNTKKDDHDRPDRSATSRGIAALVLGLRERFEQLGARILEFGRNIRRERWVHAARFDVHGGAHQSPGIPAPGAGAAHVEEDAGMTLPSLRPGVKP